MSDVYTPPKAELRDEVEVGQYGSVERALAGDYQLNIKEIFTEAWSKVLGAKATVAIVLVIPIIISLVISFIGGFISSGSNLLIDGVIVPLVTYAITLPMYAGIFMIALKRSVNAPINVNQIFQHWDKTLRLLGLYIVMTVLILVGIVLLVLPGIYLMVAYTMAVPLMIEKDMGIWEALETSRKAITKKWFKFFGFGLVSMLAMLVGFIALVVGLLWAAPLVLIAYGIAYRNIFGIEEKTLKA